MLKNTYKFHGNSVKNFKLLSKSELLEVLEWRNSETTRKMMNNPSIIEIDDHFRFVERLKSEEGVSYFKVANLGVVYLIGLENETPFLGLYVNPNNPSRGKGSTLMNLILYLAFEVLNLRDIGLEVLSYNTRAFKLYKKFGFEVIEEDKRRKLMKLSNDQYKSK